MKMTTLLACASIGLGVSAFVHTGVAAAGTGKLGQELTGVGAEKKGNADGSIPDYTGGLTAAPADYKPESGLRPDPFAADKPLETITKQNLSKFADKLTPGTQELIKRYEGYKVVIYPTHRSIAYPQSVIENTAKNVQTAKLSDDGNSLQGAYGGIPFPVPKNGNEVIWNHLTHYEGGAYQYVARQYLSDANNNVTMSAQFNWLTEQPFYGEQYTHDTYDGKVNIRRKTVITGPARKAGEATMAFDSLEPAKIPRRAYQYLPGQRRVRLAPDLAFDTPNPNVGGAATFDDVAMYNGSLERYDFKLVGKKEMFIPYNNYRMLYWTKGSDLMAKGFINPDVVRWELHRVWVVEAALKPGQRHVYAKRTFYVDEDSWSILATETYDARGQMFRVGYAYGAPSYDVLAPSSFAYGFYDLNSRMYFLTGHTAETGGLKYAGFKPEREWQPDALVRTGVR